MLGGKGDLKASGCPQDGGRSLRAGDSYFFVLFCRKGGW